jgi:hypothetical protein
MQKEMIDKQNNLLYNSENEKLLECYRKLKSLGLAIARFRGKNTQIEININPKMESSSLKIK